MKLRSVIWFSENRNLSLAKRWTKNHGYSIKFRQPSWYVLNVTDRVKEVENQGQRSRVEAASNFAAPGLAAFAFSNWKQPARPPFLAPSPLRTKKNNKIVRKERKRSFRGEIRSSRSIEVKGSWSFASSESLQRWLQLPGTFDPSKGHCPLPLIVNRGIPRHMIAREVPERCSTERSCTGELSKCHWTSKVCFFRQIAGFCSSRVGLYKGSGRRKDSERSVPYWWVIMGTSKR